MLLSRKDCYDRMLDTVDVNILEGSSIRIRFRHAALVIDPGGQGSKTSADAVVFLDPSGNLDLSRVTDYRLIVKGAGEYEVGGVKIEGVRSNAGFIYNIIGDGLSVFLGKTQELSKLKEEVSTSPQVAILNVDSQLEPSIITKLEPKVSILYGSSKEDGVKALGKENIIPTKKTTILKDKLPLEMEVVMLG